MTVPAPSVSFFVKIENAIKTFFQKDVEPLWHNDIEPALISFAKQVDHDFVQKWMPTALSIVTNLLTSGTALTTAVLGQAATELEQTALKTGETVLSQDALTTIQAAAAHVVQAAAAVTPAKPAA